MKVTPGLVRFAVVLLVASAAPGCAALRPPVPSSAQVQPELAIWERLSFGRNIPRGGKVSDADWAKFLAEVVTPRFPGGFAVTRGEGQWRDQASGAVVHEQNFILSLNHADDAAGDRLVEEIIAEYKRRFSQDAVFRMRLHVDATISFFGSDALPAA
jgi:hypothetical protein